MEERQTSLFAFFPLTAPVLVGFLFANVPSNQMWVQTHAAIVKNSGQECTNSVDQSPTSGCDKIGHPLQLI